jgi:HlyD family secretion protein
MNFRDSIFSRAAGPIALAALLCAGCGGQKAAETDTSAQAAQAAPTVQVAAVKRGTIEDVMGASGTLTAPRDREATLAPSVAGVLEALPVRVGQTVRAGQLVARLSNRPLLGQIDQAKATIQQNLVQVQQARVNALQQQASSRSTILQAQAAVANAKATQGAAEAALIGSEAAVTNAQQTLSRAQSLFGEGLVAQKDVEAAQAALRTSVAAAAAQRQTVAAQRQTVEGQKRAVEAAQAASLQDVVKRQDISVARQQVRNAQGALETSRAQLTLYTLRAPLTGQVTAVGAAPGEAVDTAAKLVTITNLDVLQLQMFVTSEKARALHRGQTVTFQTDSLPGRTFQSVIKTVGSQLDPVSGSVPVFAAVANPGHVLKDDLYVKARIVVDRHIGALIVPKSAVLDGTDGAQTVVMVSDDGTTHIKPVKTGLRQGDNIEILSGVAPKDHVVTLGGYGLPDGTKVTVAKDEAKP